MAHNRRQCLMVDRKVQGILLVRVIAYWLIAVAAIGLMVGFQVVMEGSHASVNVIVNRALLHFGPALLAAVLLLPILLLDCLRTTSKFAGPIHRLHQEMRNLADGEPAEPLLLRKNDLYADLANEFNRLLERVQGPAADTETRSQGDREATPPETVCCAQDR
jgi:signal transduction histidine kinase